MGDDGKLVLLNCGAANNPELLQKIARVTGCSVTATKGEFEVNSNESNGDWVEVKPDGSVTPKNAPRGFDGTSQNLLDRVFGDGEEDQTYGDFSFSGLKSTVMEYTNAGVDMGIEIAKEYLSTYDEVQNRRSEGQRQAAERGGKAVVGVASTVANNIGQSFAINAENDLAMGHMYGQAAVAVGSHMANTATPTMLMNGAAFTPATEYDMRRVGYSPQEASDRALEYNVSNAAGTLVGGAIVGAAVTAPEWAPAVGAAAMSPMAKTMALNALAGEILGSGAEFVVTGEVKPSSLIINPLLGAIATPVSGLSFLPKLAPAIREPLRAGTLFTLGWGATYANNASDLYNGEVSLSTVNSQACVNGAFTVVSGFGSVGMAKATEKTLEGAKPFAKWLQSDAVSQYFGGMPLTFFSNTINKEIGK